MDAELVEYVKTRGTFSLQVVPRSVWFGLDQRLSLPQHKTVLQPLLAAASACWAYEIAEGTEVHAAAASILTKSKGKHLVCLEGDPITGRELFWNASGGKRGTLVVVVPADKFDGASVFPHCDSTRAMSNPSSGHTPSAYKFARSLVSNSDVVACCIPRNNGFEWMDIVARPEAAAALFQQAASYAPDNG
jgi:hypothetical protein